MYYQEDDRSRMGLRGPEKSWAPIENYNPDRNRSFSALYIEDRGPDIIWMMQVKGLGVICMRALSSWSTETGKLEFAGVSCFPKSDLGYCPDL